MRGVQYYAFLWVPIVIGLVVALGVLWLILPRQRRREDLSGRVRPKP